VTITATDGASVKVTNSNAISVGNQSAIILGSSGPAPGGSAANAPVVVQTATNASAGPGRYGDGSNTIDIGSNSTILINRNASVISTGTQGTSEAINPYGFGNTITNYGLIQGGPSTAIWFQDVGPANSARNLVDNFGVIVGGQAIGSSGSVGLDFINETGAQVTGNLQFPGGNDTVTLHPGSQILGNLNGGGGSNLLTLNASSNSSDALSGSLANFETLNKTGAGSWTLSGSIGNNTAAGSTPLAVNVLGGTLILTGVNAAFNGSIMINPGVNLATPGPDPEATLEGTAQSLPRTITDHGVLLFNQVLPGSFGGLVQGSGQVTKIGAGVLTLSGANTYSGGTNLNVGVIAVGADHALGAPTGPITFNGGTLQFNGAFDLSPNRSIVLNGASAELLGGGVIDTDGHATIIAQGMAGAGGLTEADSAALPGVLILSGNNTYSGGTTMAAGTVQLGAGGNSGSIVGNVVDNGTLAFDRGDIAVFSGVISGTGAVTQIGAGTTILDAASTYTGGTRIIAGVLQLGSGGVAGAIVGNVADFGTLAFNRSNTLVFPGAISGTGGVAQLGTGVTILNANYPFTGGTTVSAGSLAIGDAAHGAASLSGGGGVTIASGASFGGYGAVVGVVTNKGVLAVADALPSFAQGPVGNFNIDGGLVNEGLANLAGAKIGNTLSLSGNYSTGSSGGALELNTLLNGGGPLSNQTTDRLLIAGGATGNTSVIVHAFGSGVPTSLTTDRADEGISLIQVAGSSFVSAFALQGGYVTGGTPYQYHLNAYGPGSPNGAASVAQNLVGNSGASWDYRLQTAEVTPFGIALAAGAPSTDPRLQVAAQIPAYISTPNALFGAGFQDLETLLRRLGEIRDDQYRGSNAQYEVFARGYGSALNYTSDRSFENYGFNSSTQYGALQFGGNWIASSNASASLRLGLAAAMGELQLQPIAVDGASRGSFTTNSIAATLTWLSQSGLYFDAVVSGGVFEGDIATAARGHVADISGDSFSASIEAGAPIPLGPDGFAIEPQMQLVFQHLDFAKFSDTDQINVDLGDPNQGIIRAGARFSKQVSGPDEMLLTPYIRGNILQGVGGGGAVSLGGVNFATGHFGTMLEGGGGVAGSITRGLSIFGDVTWQNNITGGGSRGWNANGGVRCSF
jgi:outer membrane autotransporter protein